MQGGILISSTLLIFCNCQSFLRNVGVPNEWNIPTIEVYRRRSATIKDLAHYSSLAENKVHSSFLKIGKAYMREFLCHAHVCPASMPSLFAVVRMESPLFLGTFTNLESRTENPHQQNLSKKTMIEQFDNSVPYNVDMQVSKHIKCHKRLNTPGSFEVENPRGPGPESPFVRGNVASISGEERRSRLLPGNLPEIQIEIAPPIVGPSDDFGWADFPLLFSSLHFSPRHDDKEESKEDASAQASGLLLDSLTGTIR